MNMRQLRDTRQLKAWLQAGKTVELKDRDRLIGRIIPENGAGEWATEMPDFEARGKEDFGHRAFPNVVLEERKRVRC